MRKNRSTQLMMYALLLVSAGVFLMPFIWMVSSSFKDLETIFEYPPSFLPKENLSVYKEGKRYRLAQLQDSSSQRVMVLDRRPGQTLVSPETNGTPTWVSESSLTPLQRIHFRTENYREAWSAKPFTRFLMNTLLITIGCIVGQVLSASLVAFSFARLEWPGRNLLFILMLCTLMLPAEVTLIPNYLIFRQLGWIDTFLPLIVPSFLGGGAFAIFLFRQFFLTIPRELDEAARVDGASSFAIYRDILMPLCKPIVATIAVLSFVSNWNDFLAPLIYLNSTDNFTLAIGLRLFQGAYETDTHLLMAASTLALLPVILVFFIGQKHFVKSIVLSGTNR